MDTKILNNSAVCQVCDFEYYPDMSHHNDTNRCDDCIEYEIDSVYSHRSYDNPYGDTEPLQDNESVCSDCGEVFTVSDKSCGHYLCPECYNVEVSDE